VWSALQAGNWTLLASLHAHGPHAKRRGLADSGLPTNPKVNWSARTRSHTTTGGDVKVQHGGRVGGVLRRGPNGHAKCRLR